MATLKLNDGPQLLPMIKSPSETARSSTMPINKILSPRSDGTTFLTSVDRTKESENREIVGIIQAFEHNYIVFHYKETTEEQTQNFVDAYGHPELFLTEEVEKEQPGPIDIENDSENDDYEPEEDKKTPVKSPIIIRQSSKKKSMRALVKEILICFVAETRKPTLINLFQKRRKRAFIVHPIDKAIMFEGLPYVQYGSSVLKGIIICTDPLDNEFHHLQVNDYQHVIFRDLLKVLLDKCNNVRNYFQESYNIRRVRKLTGLN